MIGANLNLRAFTNTWTKDLKGRGIRVNTISPGAIDTPSLRKASEATEDESRIRALTERNPLGRIGTPDEVASVVAFFLQVTQRAMFTGSSCMSTAA